MASDTYREFLDRWSQFIGSDYRSATARMPWGDSVTYVGVSAVKEHTWRYLAHNLNSANSEARWLARVQLLLDPDAKYQEKSKR